MAGKNKRSRSLLLPENWPSDVQYITAPDFSPLSSHHRRALKASRIQGLRVGEGGEGVFADRRWGAFEVVGEVCGDIVLQRSDGDGDGDGDGGGHGVGQGREGDHVLDRGEGSEVGGGRRGSLGLAAVMEDGCQWSVWADVSHMSNEMGLVRVACRDGRGEANVGLRCSWMRGAPSLLFVTTKAVEEGQEMLACEGEASAIHRGGEREGGNSSACCDPPFRQWPARLVYSNAPRYRGPQHLYSYTRLCKTNGVSVRMVDDAGHPASGQRGLFAERGMRPGEVVGEYCGVVVHSKHTGGYVACLVGYAGDASSGGLRALLGGQTMVGIDAETAGNEMRMTNDYRGVGQRGASCCFSRGWVRGCPALFVVTVREVGEGEELLLDYGELYWKHFLRGGADGDVDDDGDCEPQAGHAGQVNAQGNDEELLELERGLLEMVMQAEEELE